MLVFRPFPSLTISIYILGFGLLRCDQQVAAHHCVRDSDTPSIGEASFCQQRAT